MDLSDNDLVNTKLDNGTMSIYSLLDYWYMKYGIEKYQRDFAKEYIKKLEKINEFLYECWAREWAKEAEILERVDICQYCKLNDCENCDCEYCKELTLKWLFENINELEDYDE